MHSKMIIGFSFGKTMDTSLVTRTLAEAVANHQPATGLILHTDQGAQYTSSVFQAQLNKLDISHSYSRKGCPYDNAEIESFHAT